MTELLQKAFHVEVERQEAREELERQEVREELERHEAAMIDFDEQLRSLSQRLKVDRPVRRGSRLRSSPGVAAAKDSDSGPEYHPNAASSGLAAPPPASHAASSDDASPPPAATAAASAGDDAATRAAPWAA